MNSVCIIGRITKEIELRQTANGISAVSMTVAINNGKDKDGNERPADFPKIYVYDKQAENIKKYCHKGSLIGVEGKIKTRSWEQDDGTKRYETYIFASKVQFLDSKQNSNPIPEPEYVPGQANQEGQGNQDEDPFKDFGEEVEISDAELPW